jgi:hypothetical protein
MLLFGQEVATALAPELAITQTLPRTLRECFISLKLHITCSHMDRCISTRRVDVLWIDDYEA